MSEIPPLRPRQVVGRNAAGDVMMDQVFLRWLEILARRSETGAVSSDMAPVGVSCYRENEFDAVAVFGGGGDDLQPVATCCEVTEGFAPV